MNCLAILGRFDKVLAALEMVAANAVICQPLPVARQHFPNFPLSPLWIRSDKRKAEPGTVSPIDPQAAAAIDELKALLNEGERLVSRFQIDSVKPTFPEIEEWRQKARDRARQNVLTNFVGPKDLAKFDTAWDEGELLRGLAVLKHLCGAVDRLKELIAKIEAKNATGYSEQV